MPSTYLQARDLHKRYGRIVALDGVSLAIERRELFGFVGPNGAGKSTTLSILGGLLDADIGTVMLNGKEITRREQNQRRLIGFGTQDLAVYPELTARENLRFFGRLYEIQTSKLNTRIDHLLSAVGLSDRASDRVGGFSGGMKRRLNLAVAVVHEPEVLFLDEPTTGVDPQSRFHIFELVRHLNAAGMTIVYTSHYLEEVQMLCPRIAIIDHGRIMACDTTRNLLKLLNASLRLDGLEPKTEIVTAFSAIPGVTRVNTSENSIELIAENSGPILPAVAEVCRKLSLTPTSLAVSDPTLEKVFLQLTGDALRD